MARRKLIILTRYPDPGMSKSRLIPVLGPDGAAEIHSRMTEHTLDTALGLGLRRSQSLEVWGGGWHMPSAGPFLKEGGMSC